jgi:hypothetical protein
VHHDKAPAHTAKFTQSYIQTVTDRFGIRFIASNDIPVKAPDASPLEFFGFGHLKGAMGDKTAKNLTHLWNIARRE